MFLRQRSCDRGLEADAWTLISRASTPDIPGEDAPLLMHAEHDHPDDPPQQGVRDIEAVRSIWTPRLLKTAYLFVFLVVLGCSLETQASANLVTYVTSDFSQHALVSTISVSTGLVAGVARVPIAKLIDIWGRGEGYAAMVACTTLGLVLMAACRDVATYAIAQVFYWVGFDGIGYVLQVFLADTSSLRNRALAFSLSSTPYILTTFAGPAVAQYFQDTWNWRWAYITFAITTPLVSLPIIYLLFHTKYVAIRKGILKPNDLKRREPWLQQAKRFAIQFDAVGSIFFTIGLALILLPLSQRALPSTSDGSTNWLSASSLSKFLAGYASLCLFGVWEWKYAPVRLIPYRVVFRDRTVLGSCLLCFGSFATFNAYHAYFPSYLQVARYLSIREAGYVANIFSLTSCLLGIAFAYIIRQTGQYKRLALWALPLRGLAAVALVPSVRDPHATSATDVIACQLANAVAGAVLVVANQTAVNAAVAHSDIAMVLAVLLLFSSVGGSVGTAVAGAVWTASMPGLLRDFLPPGKKHLAEELYGSLKKQLEWEPGTDVRDAVVRAYCVTQARLCVVAAASLPFVVVFVMMWRELPVKDEEEDGKDKRKGEGPVEHGD
ncbi:siderophore iron transporter mirb [Diplodia corticola]|uniref:Siderophore iron transporter mirb n=1 Tax=Diplodia corticola TaxID=236234 RepID=A0A1J9S788_9PEZI|nr:siderophore iron transporter mirb [Diplodia corticola]OJD40819.1 siderophore iron transporter mirb [Diplodia corticola]